MTLPKFLCTRCGSADVRAAVVDGVAKGTCFRCDAPFEGTPCPHCGGFEIDGSYGVSGMRFAELPETVTCRGCGAQLALRDPGPETAGQR